MLAGVAKEVRAAAAAAAAVKQGGANAAAPAAASTGSGAIVAASADGAATAGAGGSGASSAAAPATDAAASSGLALGKAGWGDLPETLQRLLAESCVHWGQFYERVLRLAHNRRLNEQYGVEEDEEGSNRSAAGDDAADIRAEDAAADHVRGEGEEREDLAASDHEGDVHLLAAAPAAGSGAGVGVGLRGPPFSELVFRATPAPLGKSFCPAAIGGSRLSALLSASALPDVPAPERVTSFEAARDIFKAANGAFARAQEYFVVDGFVTDHINILQSLSKCYKYVGAGAGYCACACCPPPRPAASLTMPIPPLRPRLCPRPQLAVWEPDAKRRAAMHGRRVDMLAPLLDALNTSVYLVQHKELSIEAGAAGQEQFDARCARLEARMAAGEAGPDLRADAKAANDTADRAIKYYGHFLRCYNEPRLGASVPIDGRNKPQPALHGAAALDDASAGAYITSHFCIARLLSRRLPLDSREKLEDLRASLARYTWILEHGRKIAPAETTWGEDFMPEEAAMCAEMTRLLPQQINQLHYRGVDVTQSAAAQRAVGGGGGGGGGGVRRGAGTGSGSGQAAAGSGSTPPSGGPVSRPSGGKV
jgi:hypothetical protein